MQVLILAICLFSLFELQRIVYRRYWSHGLKLKIEFDKQIVMEGDKNCLTEEVYNKKKLPLPVLHVKFCAPRSFIFEKEESTNITDHFYRDDKITMSAWQKVTRTLPFICNKRGCYTLYDASLVSSDLLLTDQFIKKQKLFNVIKVYPSRLPTDQFIVIYQSILEDIIVKKALNEDPFEFNGMRDYQPYDSMRDVNWKASARNMCLLVNKHNPVSSNNKLIFCLNVSDEMNRIRQDLIESAIRITASLSERFISDRISVGLETNARDYFTGERIMEKAGATENHMNTLDYNFAHIDLTKKCYDFIAVLKDVFAHEKPGNNVFVVVSPSLDPSCLEYCKSLRSIGYNIVFIVPIHISKPISHNDLTQNDIIYRWEV